MMADKGPVWFLENLVKKGAKFNAKIKILDTVLGTSDKSYPLLWIYTDINGFAKTKLHHETTPERILSTFLNKSLCHDEKNGGHSITEKGFELITKSALTNKVLDQCLYEDRGVQSLPELTSYTTKRFIIHSINGITRFLLQYTCNTETIEKKLKSTHHCNIMSKVLNESVKTIEKNLGSREKRFKVHEISLVFIEDAYNTLWLMGASSIKCDYITNTHNSMMSSTKSISDMTYLQLTVSPKSMKSLTESESFFKALKLNRGQVPKAACAGNFCKFVLTSKSTNSDNQYEQFLEKVIETKRRGHDNETEAKKKSEKESENIKLGLRTDYLLTRRLQHTKHVSGWEIPYKYVLMGREILEYSNFDKHSRDLVEIGIGKIIEFIKTIKERYDVEGMKQIAENSPFHYYDMVKVCNRCYLVYSLFTLRFKSSPQVNEKSESKKKVMNKDNLDELLEDIVEYKGELSRHKSIVNMSKGMFAIQLNARSEVILPNIVHEVSTVNPRTTISLVKSADLEYQNLIHECFPDAQKIGKIKRTGKQSYTKYLKHLEKGFNYKNK